MVIDGDQDLYERLVLWQAADGDADLVHQTIKAPRARVVGAVVRVRGRQPQRLVKARPRHAKQHAQRRTLPSPREPPRELGRRAGQQSAEGRQQAVSPAREGRGGAKGGAVVGACMQQAVSSARVGRAPTTVERRRGAATLVQPRRGAINGNRWESMVKQWSSNGQAMELDGTRWLRSDCPCRWPPRGCD